MSLNEWLQQLETKHNKKIDLGLKRVRKVYQALKLEKISPTIITVAGTNGKGSTVAILSSICQQAGYKVGAFTSPHIIDFNERIKINNKNASDKQIITAFETIECNLNGITLSYFEYATLAALIIFKQRKVDIAILEVGLGGRLDSVNVVDTDCAIITTIDIDHTDWLGDNIESIGFEKAGIMRENKPVIYGDRNCPQSIIQQAQIINAELSYSDESIELPQLNIAGDFQLKNARTAITALKLVQPQLTISEEQIRLGLQSIQLQARLQVISENPQVIVDVSHNKQAAICLSNWLRSNPIEGKTLAVFAVLADKNPMDWLNKFSDIIDIWCISQVDCDRAMPTKDLLKVLANSAQLITSFTTVKLALEKAKIMANENDRIIVFGSFYTVSEIMN